MPRVAAGPTVGVSYSAAQSACVCVGIAPVHCPACAVWLIIRLTAKTNNPIFPFMSYPPFFGECKKPFPHLYS